MNFGWMLLIGLTLAVLVYAWRWSRGDCGHNLYEHLQPGSADYTNALRVAPRDKPNYGHANWVAIIFFSLILGVVAAPLGWLLFIFAGWDHMRITRHWRQHKRWRDQELARLTENTEKEAQRITAGGTPSGYGYKMRPIPSPYKIDYSDPFR